MDNTKLFEDLEVSGALAERMAESLRRSEEAARRMRAAIAKYDNREVMVEPQYVPRSAKRPTQFAIYCKESPTERIVLSRTEMYMMLCKVREALAK